MRTVQQTIYHQVERKLHRLWAIANIPENETEKIISIPCDANDWLKAIRMTNHVFPEVSTQEGMVAMCLFGKCMTIKDTGTKLGKTRGVIKRLRDNYVAHCALFAAALGLIDIRKGQDDGKTELLADP